MMAAAGRSMMPTGMSRVPVSVPVFFTPTIYEKKESHIHRY